MRRIQLLAEVAEAHANLKVQPDGSVLNWEQWRSALDALDYPDNESERFDREIANVMARLAAEPSIGLSDCVTTCPKCGRPDWCRG